MFNSIIAALFNVAFSLAVSLNEGSICGMGRFCLDPELVPVKLKLKLELIKLDTMCRPLELSGGLQVYINGIFAKKIQLRMKTF